ncbi:MAG: hypothetical protein HC917_27420 [Richelia sp. SM2_1_7]|nr:hypothetical protein [Richelia sp. SM2_1_7]
MTGLLYTKCELYIDDIIIFGSSMDTFISNLEEVFSRLREFNITLNPEKAKIALTQLEYVGHVIHEKWIGMSEEKIQKILDFPQPTTFKQMKRFVGLLNYFQEHVRNFQIQIVPLQNLIKGYEKHRGHLRLVWTSEAQAAYDKLMQLIADCPKLYFVQPNAPIILETDASDFGIGAYLYQVIDNVQYPISFLSKALDSVKQRWSTIEKECYAIWYALHKWEFLLRDTHFTIRTDHANLKYLNTNTPKVTRWKLAIQEFDFVLDDVRGPDNVPADTLSRLSEEEEKVENHIVATVMSSEGHDLPNSAKEFKIPDTLYKMIALAHNELVGHAGIELTLKRVQALNQDHRYTQVYACVKKFVRECPVCQKVARH